MKKSFCFGIDLGTTNSALAVYTGGTSEIVNVDGRSTIPSVVWYHPDGTTTVGREAYARKGRPDVVYSSKRDMGTDKVYHLTLEDGSTKDVTPIDVASEVLKAIVEKSDKSYGTVIESVITVPAYFNDKQRTATRLAAEKAGIQVVAMVNEPTAAAFAYGIDKNKNCAETVIVIDVGGGTTDITYMTITNFETEDSIPEELRDIIKPGLSFEVIATNGNNRLGGDDFDELIIEKAKARLLKECDKRKQFIKKSNDKGKDKLYKEIASEKNVIRERFITDIYKPMVESWKKQSNLTALQLVYTEADGSEHSFLVTDEDKQNAYKSFWKKVCDCIIGVVSIYDNTETDDENKKVVDTLPAPAICIPVGGSTKNPMMLQDIRDLFGNSDIVIPDSRFADEAIALGAAIKCAVEKGVITDISLKETNPLPIGIEVAEERNGKKASGIFYQVIPKDVTIPVKSTVYYSTYADNQTELDVRVYQGVNSYVKNNECLGLYTISGLPAKPAGEVTVELCFEIDANGILTLTATYDGRDMVVKMDSILNSAVREYSKADERAMKYLMTVRDYMESIGDIDTEDYTRVCNWMPGEPIPDYAIKNKKAIQEFTRKNIMDSVTKMFDTE